MKKIGAGITALGVKLGPKLLAVGVKLAKFIKIGKFGLAIGSMAAYAYLFTWQFAVMLMVSLFIHEYGHIWAMKRCRLKTKGIYFIPFIGAAAVTDEMFKTRKDEAYIAIMGPVWGFGLALLTALVWVVNGDTLFAAAAGWMAMVNLFNLLPVNPLDGGRIMKSIAFSINSNLGFIFLGIGIIVSIILTFWVGLILFLILLLIASLELIFEWLRYSQKREIIEEMEARNIDLTKYGEDVIIPPSMSIKAILMSATVYVMIVAVLWALMSYMNHVPEVEIARKLFMS